MLKLLCIASGGALGTILRYVVTQFSVQQKMLPAAYSSLVVNLLGSFLIGFATYFFLKIFQHENLKVFVLVGFLGGFTTFSAFAMENLQLLKWQDYKGAIFNLGLQNFGGILLAYIGFWLAEILLQHGK